MYQKRVVYSDSIASGAATSAGVDLQRTWAQVGVAVSTMSTSAQIAIQTSPDGGTTLYPIMIGVPNTASVQTNALAIASGVGTNSGYFPLPGGVSYLRFITTGVVSGGVNFKIVCQSD